MSTIKEYWFRFLLWAAKFWFDLKNEFSGTNWKALLITIVIILVLRVVFDAVVFQAFHVLVPGVVSFVLNLVLFFFLYTWLKSRVSRGK